MAETYIVSYIVGGIQLILLSTRGQHTAIHTRTEHVTGVQLRATRLAESVAAVQTDPLSPLVQTAEQNIVFTHLHIAHARRISWWHVYFQTY